MIAICINNNEKLDTENAAPTMIDVLILVQMTCVLEFFPLRLFVFFFAVLFEIFVQFKTCFMQVPLQFFVSAAWFKVVLKFSHD